MWCEFITRASRTRYHCEARTRAGMPCKNFATWAWRPVVPGPPDLVVCSSHQRSGVNG